MLNRADVLGAEAGGEGGGDVVAVRVGRGADILHREKQRHHGGDEQCRAEQHAIRPSAMSLVGRKKIPSTEATRPKASAAFMRGSIARAQG